MRELNEFEKNVIQRIVKNNQLDFISLIDHYMVEKDILLNYQNNSATIYFDQAVYLPNNNVGAHRLIDEVIKISNIIISTISLLDYLNQYNYLKLIQGSPNPDPPRFGRLVDNHQSIAYVINDKEITKLLLDNSFKSIIIEQSLIDYVNDGYISKEEKRHKQNIKWAKIGFITAIVLGVLGLIVGIVDTYYDGASYYYNKANDNKTMNPVKEICNDSLKQTKPVDTYKVKIVNDFSKDTFKVRIEK